MERGQIIELDNGKKYAIADVLIFDRNRYVYIINIEDNRDIKFAEFDDHKINFVNDDNLYSKLMHEVFNRQQDLN